jgi:hypothetical protein
MSDDREHLRILSIFHYVVAGFSGCFACFPIFHLIMGLVMVIAPGEMAENGEAFPLVFGLLFVGMATLMILAGWTLAVLIILTGRRLARQTHYMFCLVMGGVECIFMPFGTVLGIFTIIVLTRPTVKRLFGQIPDAETAA